MGSEKFVENISVSNVEKRYKPSRHYVFVLQVTWSDGVTFPIFRKYTEFYDFHIELVDQFPKQAGFGGTRVIPYLPGKKLIRSESEKVASKRKVPIEEYCRNLIKLEDEISKHDDVIEFFRARNSDINPPKDATKKPDRSGIFAALGIIIPKFKKKSKSSTGSISDGGDEDIYVSGPVNFDTYYVIADYTAQARGELTLEEGTEVEVVEKNDNGWWFLSLGTEQGWAPASFLEPVNTAVEMDEPEPLYNGETYITLKAYEAQLEDEISFPQEVIVEAIHKLLDGWWIISYEGKVGHAPATYLQEYSNPHFNPTALKNFKPKKVKAPTQRRCTIKNRKSKWGEKKPTLKKDMKTYRQMSVKISQRQRMGKASRPQPPQPPARRNPSLVEETEEDDELYINNEEAISLATRAVNHGKPSIQPRPYQHPFPKPRYSPQISEKTRCSDVEPLPDYLDIDESQMNDAVGGNFDPDYEINEFSSNIAEDDTEYINVMDYETPVNSSSSTMIANTGGKNNNNTTNTTIQKVGGVQLNLFSQLVPLNNEPVRPKKPAAAPRGALDLPAKNNNNNSKSQNGSSPFGQDTKPKVTMKPPSKPPHTAQARNAPVAKGILAQRLAQFDK